MSKSAALKKAVVMKKASVKASKPSKAKKPMLKVVKPSPKTKMAAKPSKAKKTAPKLKAVAKKAAPAKAVAKQAAPKAAPKVAAKVVAPAKKPMDARLLFAKQPYTPAAPVVAKPAQRPVIRQTTGFSRPAYKIETKSADAGKKIDFKVGAYVVYPTHGVGKIMAEETQDIGGHKLKMFVIVFEKDKMTLRVPVARAQAAGLRHISSNSEMQKMFETLKGKAKASRGMWSRRAQEYESKINSGNVFLIAEVVRDLHQNVDQAERSYSERMIYESAFNRLAGELAASNKLDLKTASDKLLAFMRARKAA
jgi:CarD family transcriptional regulator